MNSEFPLSPAHPGHRREPGHFLCVLGLLLILLASHGLSLWDGLFFDDHWHRAASRHYGWSPKALLDSATVDLSGKLNHLWWQENRMVWQYARPVAMLVTKVEYILSGEARGNPMWIHAFALGWHGLTALLLYALAYWAGLPRTWAFAAGALFLIQPHSVFTVGWTAARNALVGGCFFVAAVLAYGLASFNKRYYGSAFGAIRFLVPLVLWLLALLSRETALVFPLVIVVLDLSLGGWRHLRHRIVFHLMIWAFCAAFIAWRTTRFSVGEVPAIYFNKPSGLTDWAYSAWAVSKLLQLLFSQVFYTPMLMGLATYEGLPRELWIVHGIMLAVVVAVAIWYLITSRGQRARWLWPIWVVAAFVPVVPVFAMPHFDYLPSIAYAVMLATMLAGLPVGPRKTITIVVVAATLWSLGVYRAAWCGIVRSEQLVYEDMTPSHPTPGPGDKLFFINLPIAAIYAPDAMREIWGVEDIEGYTLTFAPHPLQMDKPCIVEQLNDHEILVSTTAPGYFSGSTGQMLLDGTRPDAPLTTGTTVDCDGLFEATVIQGDVSGITKIRFTFRERLDNEHYFFYLCSPERPAYRLTFRLSTLPDNQDAALFEQARSDDVATRSAARLAIRDLARPVAVAMGDPVQTWLGLQSDQALDHVEAWWHTIDVHRRYRDIKKWQEEYAWMLRQRKLYFDIMNVMERCVQSDLFLTGQN